MSPTWEALFKKAVRDDSTVELEYTEIYPTTNLANIDTASQIKCQINDKAKYYIPHLAYTRVEGQIMKQNGAGAWVPIVAGDNASVALMNNAWNLLRRPGLTFDGTRLNAPEKDVIGALAEITAKTTHALAR